MPPGGTCSLHLLSSGLAPLLRNRSVPSRRASLQVGPMYRAMICVPSPPLDATLLRRTTAVVRYRRDVGNARDLQAAGVERTHCRFAPGTGTADANLDVLDAVLLSRGAGLFGGHLSRERRALARAAEAAAARGRPRQGVALPVGDRNDRVIERCMYVSDGVEHVLTRLLGLFGPAAAALLLRCLLISHKCGRLPAISRSKLDSEPFSRASGFAWRRVELHGLLARALAGASVSTGALASDRQPLAVPHPAPGAQIHQPLDVHRYFAPQVALDRPFGDLRADRRDFGVGQVLDAGGRRNARTLQDLERARSADAEDVGQPDAHMLVHRDIDAGYACHDALPQPWRCLWRASVLQITNTTPQRRTILQFLQIFLTDGRTFMAHLR